MRLKVLSVLAAVLLLGACESAQQSATGGAAGGLAGGGAGAGAAVPGSVRDFQQNVGDRVFFSFDRYDLSPEARDALNRQAQWLQQYQSVRVTIEGHCDERGTREYNLALGDRRANAARNYLVALGVPASRITTISYGKERPPVAGSGEAVWQQNRTAITVLAGGAPGT